MRNLRRVLCTAGVLSAGVLLAAAGSASAAVLIGVKTSPAYEQVPGTGGGTYFAWSRGFPATLFIQSDAGQPAVRVNNPRNSQAWAGSIDGTTLVYQRAHADQSDIRLWDVVAKTPLPPPAGVNTPNWEWHPTMSGDWILFGRVAYDRHRSRVLLHNTMTSQTITLADVQGLGTDAEPGQVSGNWAVWDRCAHGVCNVFRYDITDDLIEPLPNDFVGKLQYFPSVTSAGTVYYVHSGNGCGRNVKLIEGVPAQPQTLLVQFGPGRDVTSTTQTVPDQTAGTDVYFDKYKCSNGTSDIYKIVVP